MWASCCNWFCLDSAPGNESNSGGSTRNQAYTNSGYSSYPSPTAVDHTCKACGGRFDTLARKHVCMDCKKSFCGRCSAQLSPRPRLCHTCQRLCATLFQRAELMKLKVKDLRDYLHLHEVPTQTCREKEELVELVLGQQTPGPANTANARGTQHTRAPSGGNAHTRAPSSGNSHTRAPSSGSTHRHHHHNGAQQQQQNGQTAPTAAEQAPVAPTVTQPQSEPTQDDSQSSDTEEVLVPGRRASLSDLSAVEDIEALSVRQLKEILARNFVNYKGCCEKWELMERVTRLYHDQKDLQNLVSNASDGKDAPSGPVMEENLCKICMDSPIDCVLLECGHMVTCTKCGKRMSECPICRQYVVRAVHVFRS